MMRAISIVLIVAIALQTVGCSAWRPLARMNEAPEDDRQSSMRDQVLGKLKEGMAIRIRIRDGTPTQIKGQVLECIVEKIGKTTLTLTASTYFFPDNVSRRLTLNYPDIESIEYRESNRGLPVFVAGVAVGTVLGYFLFLYGLSGIQLD